MSPESFSAAGIVAGLVEGSPSAYGPVTVELHSATLTTGVSLPSTSAAMLGALQAGVAAELRVPVANVTAEASATRRSRRGVLQSTAAVALKGAGLGRAPKREYLCCRVSLARRHPLLCSREIHSPPPQRPPAVAGVAPTNAAVRQAGSLLSSGAALAALLTQAGFPVAASAISPTAPQVVVLATLSVNLIDGASSAQAAAAEQAAAVASGLHSAGVGRAMPGAVVQLAGAATVKGASPPGALPAFVPAPFAQTCSAVGLSCFPGVQCQLPSIVGAALGEPIRCGECPRGFRGAQKDRRPHTVPSS